MISKAGHDDERCIEVRDWIKDASQVTIMHLPPWAESLSRCKSSGSKSMTHASRDAWVSIEPDWSLGQLDAVLRRFSRDRSGSQLILGFHNLGSSSSIIHLLEDRTPSSGWTETDVIQRAAAVGLTVTKRRAFHRPCQSQLAQNTREAISRLVEQLNPHASNDWLLLALESQQTVAMKTDRVPGLLSVVIRNQSLKRAAMLDQTIFSLSGQYYQPLEIILVSQSQEQGVREQLASILNRHQSVGQYTFSIIVRPSSEDVRAQLINIGIQEASGQYLAFLDDDDVIYPNHYSQLIAAIQASDKAWAFSTTRRAYFTQLEDGTLFCTKKDTFPRSESLALAPLLHDNYVTCHSYVLDRTRLARFELSFEERLDKGEDYAFLLRLLALFRPVALGGAATAEYRIRDNGSNTIVHDTNDIALRQRLKKQWEASIELKNRLTANLQILVTKEELLQEVINGLSDNQTGEPEEIRYRLADFANSMLKKSLPLVHSRVKAGLAPRLGHSRKE